MCGIAGIVSKEGVENELLVRVSKILRHRGPDDEGYFINGQLFKGDDSPSSIDLPHVLENQSRVNVGLVHRRLSILDVSVKGHQPMQNDGLTLVFNGEIYNYRELREELKQKGHQFDSDSDSEVILKGYQEWGESLIPKMKGMWALVVLQGDELFVSRDRFGIKPFYYTQKDGLFAFASEIKALVKTGIAQSKVANAKMMEFLSFGTLAIPFDNLFDEVKDLPPGTNGKYNVNTGEFRTRKYYSAAPNRSGESFKEVFERSIQLHLRSDVTIGSCLSGGLDSSAIVVAAMKQLDSFSSYTASFPGTSVDEAQYVKMIEDQYSSLTANYCTPQSEDLLNQMDQLIYHQDLPIGSSSIFAQWSVMELASEHKIKVLLDGQGADEVFGGYYNFAGIQVIELLKKGRFIAALKSYNQLKENFTPAMKNAVARALYYFLPVGLQRKLRKDNRMGMHLISADFQEELKGITIPKRGGKSFVDHSLLSLEFGMYELLRYEDRNSMAFSIESRVPFLDHELVELALGLSSKEKMKGGWTKYPIRKYLEGKLPDELVFRKDKIGFATPQSEWKKEVEKEIKNYFLENNLPKLFNKDFILDICNKENMSNSQLSEFWRLYSVVKWMELFKVELV